MTTEDTKLILSLSPKDVALKLGCSEETVKVHIRKLWPELMKHGVRTELTPEQVGNILASILLAEGPHTVETKLNLSLGLDEEQKAMLGAKKLERMITEDQYVRALAVKDKELRKLSAKYKATQHKLLELNADNEACNNAVDGIRDALEEVSAIALKFNANDTELSDDEF